MFTSYFSIAPLLYFWMLAPSTTSPLGEYTSVNDYLQKDMDYLVDFYKDRHMHPEISFQESATAARLADELRNIGWQVTEGVGQTGVVGILKNGAGPTILYRTDMDALPMYEKTDLDYMSKVVIDFKGQETGAMHSCGHDMHMTTWLGTARAMTNMRSEWSGTLMFIGQPAEEIGAGAKAMLDDGLYEKFGVPDYGLGLHCSPTIPTGSIGLTDGYTMANTESIDIKVKGVGAHGASPHMSIDPVVIASMIVMEIQTIVSRNLKPIEDAVVTVGSIQGGTANNIIPDEVILKLTVRTYKQEVRELIHRRLREICDGIAMSAGVPEENYPELIIPETYTPANYNEPGLTSIIQSSASKAIGQSNVIYAEPQMVGEDFSRYGNTEHKVPTVLYWLGTVSEEKISSGNLPGLHSPYYYPEVESTISTAVEVNTAVLTQLLSK